MHASPKFEPLRDVPDLSGKIVLVTGGNSGIGYETVKVLLLKNAKVYLAARSPTKGKEAIAELETETKKQAKFLELDLADLRSIRKAAETFLAKEERLDILFNNGGVMIPATDQLTTQGYDLQFGTNALGHFFLTELLLPALMAAHAHSESSTPGRIINTTSTGHTRAPARDVFFDAVKGGPKRDALIKKNLYGASKLANIIMSDYYTQNYPGVLVSCSLHPGLIKSGIQRNGNGIFKFLTGLVFSATHVGAYTQLWAGTTASAEETNGKYFLPVGVATAPGGRTGDKQLAEEVMAYMKDAVKDF
ncbi:NAD(P)-binding protein [Mycena vitilis]|nr:NAD(P)-binding protein [Mycena vitilis]